MKEFCPTNTSMKLRVFYNEVPVFDLIPTEVINIIVSDTLEQTQDCIKKKADEINHRDDD